MAKKKKEAGSKKTESKAPGIKVAESNTRDRVKGIVRGYGLVSKPNGKTIVGPAVPSMQHFTDDVDKSFKKTYPVGTLDPGWNINITAKYIDDH